MVTIFVGKTKQPFHVHLDLLCDASSFFKAAFAEISAEASGVEMLIPDGFESTFKLFVDWLYGDRQTIYQTISPAKEDDDNHERLFPALFLFGLADKYNVYGLKTIVIEVLWEVLGAYKDQGLLYSTVAYAYNHTAQGSDIRRRLAMFVAGGVYHGKCEGTDFQVLLKQQPDLAFDIVVSFAKYFKPKQTRTRRPLPKKYKAESPGQEHEQINADWKSFLTG